MRRARREGKGGLRALFVHAGFDGVFVVGFGGVGEGAAEARRGCLRGHVCLCMGYRDAGDG